MPEGFSSETENDKVANKLKEIKEATDNYGDLALKLNALLSIRESEKDGKDLNEFNQKTKSEMESQFSDFTDSEISSLQRALETLHHSQKHNYPIQ